LASGATFRSVFKVVTAAWMGDQEPPRRVGEMMSFEIVPDNPQCC